MMKSGPLVLFGSATSPFVRKVRMCLLRKALPHEFVVRSSWSPAAAIERINPLEKVPVLQLPDSTFLYDSRVIVQYLDELQPAPALLPASGSARWRCLQLEALADGVGEATALYVQEGWRAPAARSTVWRQRQLLKVVRGLAALEAGWDPEAREEGDAWPLEEVVTVAAVGFVQLWLPDFQRTQLHPHLCRLQERLMSQPWCSTTVPQSSASPVFPSL